MKREITRLIIHCSASNSAWYDVSALRRDHLSRGWLASGYHFVIDYDGHLHCERPLGQPGSHCKLFNFDSVGICLLGHKNHSNAQFEALVDITHSLINLFELTHSDIHPHNHFNPNKECPAFNLDYWKTKFLLPRIEAFEKKRIDLKLKTDKR